jgi:hypothetical protein
MKKMTEERFPLPLCTNLLLPHYFASKEEA